MNLNPLAQPQLTRRHILAQGGLGLGTAALATLLGDEARAAGGDRATGGILVQPHHRPRAKRVISLFMSGGPSQLETFDPKPLLNQMRGEDLPESVRSGQRLTGMSAHQARLPLVGSPFKFARHGDSGTWVSELLPHTARVVDELCVIRSLHTEAINHDPAITFLQTGSMIAGRPSIGAWLSYGLGTLNADLPTYCVLITQNQGGQPLYARLWGNGFLPATHQGTPFRSSGDPVLYLNNPPGVSSQSRRGLLDGLQALHAHRAKQTGDRTFEDRIGQYEMAFRMQSSVPEVASLDDEPESSFALYGEDSRTPGTFAANCLMARRLVERDVRFVQLFHQGWDQHGNLPTGIQRQCQQTDQACAAPITDLKRRGLLEDTLVLWGGEFGRTNYSQGKLTATNFGRDHHPRCFTIWMAGGGVKPGMTLGETDEFGYHVVNNPIHVHDLHATVLHLLGIDHRRLTFDYQGRDFRLTDVHGEIVTPILM